jgi:hypothetical protein
LTSHRRGPGKVTVFKCQACWVREVTDMTDRIERLESVMDWTSKGYKKKEVAANR